MTVAGSSAVVVGGTSGIGLAAAHLLAEGGARVVVAGRSDQRLNEALASLGTGHVTGKVVDAADPASIARLFEDLPQIDHLVLSMSGPVANGPFRSLDEAAWRQAFDAKFWAYVRLLQASTGHVRRSVTLVTGAARARAVGMVGLAATNGALEAMIGTLARELAPVRINAVSAGMTDTPYWNVLPADQRQSLFAATSAALPVGRVGSPRDIAEAIVFVAGNGFTTGTVIECDGGSRLAA